MTFTVPRAAAAALLLLALSCGACDVAVLDRENAELAACTRLSGADSCACLAEHNDRLLLVGCYDKTAELLCLGTMPRVGCTAAVGELCPAVPGWSACDADAYAACLEGLEVHAQDPGLLTCAEVAGARRCMQSSHCWSDLNEMACLQSASGARLRDKCGTVSAFYNYIEKGLHYSNRAEFETCIKEICKQSHSKKITSE
eukprot:m51a1_g6115 hypothetical protein (200) ;mRNA; r:117245-122818